MDNRKTIGIVQPGRVGDIIIVLPIAKHLDNQGYKVHWPVCTQYLSMFSTDGHEYIDYVEPIDIGSEIVGSYQRAIAYLKNYSVWNILDLGIGLGRKEESWRNSTLSFDEWKYQEAGLPIKYKYTLEVDRNYDKELILMDHLGLTSRKNEYIITHSSHASCKLNHNWNMPEAIEVLPIRNYPVWDWLTILENAKALYLVDSSIANMVNQLGIAKGRRFFRSWLQDVNYKDPKAITDPKLDDGWEFVGDKN